VQNGMAAVCVSDACGGIPLEDLPRVFDVAFRGESARTPGPDGGGGLGLSIARGIVEAHSGQIAVRNAGPGCQFLVRLPLARRATAPAAPAANRVTEPPWRPAVASYQLSSGQLRISNHAPWVHLCSDTLGRLI
jgi:hypothetical protein